MTTIFTAQTLGVTLRDARKRMGLTQPDLALAAGVGVRFVVDLERGKPTVRLEQVLRVIDALGGSLVLKGLDAQLDPIEAGHHGA
jgi:y4mF family transcriptional regulator